MTPLQFQIHSANKKIVRAFYDSGSVIETGAAENEKACFWSRRSCICQCHLQRLTRCESEVQLTKGLSCLEPQGWQVTDPRQDPTSGPGKPRVLSYLCLPMHSQGLSLQKKHVKSMGPVPVMPTAASNPFGDKADFKFSPFYGKGLLEVHRLQVSQLASGRACRAKVYRASPLYQGLVTYYLCQVSMLTPVFTGSPS